MFIETTIKVLLFILIIMLGYAFVNIYAYQYIKLNDWGVWANWTSAIANILMAGAALYAAFNAKKWLDDRKKIASMNFVISFHENHILPLEKQIRECLCQIEFLVNEIVYMKDADELSQWRKEYSSIQHIEEIQGKSNRIREIYRNFYMLDVVNIRQSETKLLLYGWEIHNKNAYNSLIKKKALFFESSRITADTLDNCMALLYKIPRVDNKAIEGDEYFFFDLENIMKLTNEVEYLNKLETEINKITKKLAFKIWN